MLKEYRIKEILSFYKYVKPQAKSYLAGLFGNAACEASAAIVLPIIVMYMINATLHQDLALLRRGLVLAAIEGFVVSILFIAAQTVFWKPTIRIVADVRTMLFRSSLRLPTAYFDSHHSGDIVSRLTNDVNVFYSLYSFTISRVAVMLLTGAGSVSAMFILNWRFGLVLSFSSLLSTCLSARFMARAKKLSDKLQTALAALTGKLSDTLSGFAVMKQFGLEDILASRYREDNEEIRRLACARSRETAGLSATNYFLSWLNYTGIIAAGVYLSFFDDVNMGLLLAEITLLGNVNTVFRTMPGLLVQLQANLAGAERVAAHLELEPEPERYGTSRPENCSLEESAENHDPIQSAGGPCPPKQTGHPHSASAAHLSVETCDFGPSAEKFDSAQPAKRSDGQQKWANWAVELCGVSFQYGNEQVLQDVTMKIPQSSMTVIAGKSGAGKSTIARLLLGFYPPCKGSLQIMGTAYEDCSLQELRRRIAFVPQDAYLFNGTVAENIKIGKPNATAEDIRQAAQLANAEEFINSLEGGYETPIREGGKSLSGGQRQRIAIARAILTGAPVVLFDEATAALDSHSEKKILDTMKNLSHTRTVITIAHKQSTLERADCIFVLENGRVREAGCVSEDDPAQ